MSLGSGKQSIGNVDQVNRDRSLADHSNMAMPMQCCLYIVPAENGAVTQFSAIGFQKF